MRNVADDEGAVEIEVVVGSRMPRPWRTSRLRRSIGREGWVRRRERERRKGLSWLPITLFRDGDPVRTFNASSIMIL